MNTSNEKIPLNLSGFNSKNNFFHSENAKRKNSPILNKMKIINILDYLEIKVKKKLNKKF